MVTFFFARSNKIVFPRVEDSRVKQSSREEEWAVWMRAAVAGDKIAYQRFLVSVTPYLRGMARRRCQQFGAPPSEAEDVLQEVLLAVHLKRSTWDLDRPIGPWLSAIVRNKLIDSLRRRGRQVSLPIEDVVETLAAEDTGADGTDRMDAERLVASLGHPQQDIVRAISLNGDGVKQTAERLNMTEGAVRVALHRALKTLAALYRRQDVEDR